MWLSGFQVPIAPDGPGTPFGSPILCVIDSLRLIVLILGLLNLCMKPWLFHRCKTPGQMVRFACLGLLAVVAMTVELEHLGDTANWRLFLVLVAMIMNTWGNYSFLRYEIPTQVRPDPRITARRDSEPRKVADEDRERFRSP